MATDKPLDQRVAEWLEKSGYPLEMRVARSFLNAGFSVTQSDFYVDKRTNQHREIDVMATALAPTGTGGRIVKIHFAVECKTSRGRPWVMFIQETRRIRKRRSHLLFGPANSVGARLRGLLALDKALRDLPLFTPRSEPAYGMVQAFKDGDDASYSATMQAGKAAQALASTSEQTQTTWSRLGGIKTDAAIAFPVIVTDGQLFEARLVNPDADVAVREVKSHTLRIRNPDAGPLLSLVHVVSEAGLESFVHDAQLTCSTIFAWCRTHASEIEDAITAVPDAGKLTMDDVAKQLRKLGADE